MAVESTRIFGAQAVRRSLHVVRIVARLQRRGANLTEVARETQLNTSTAFRLLRCLCEERMLAYDPASRCYTVGPLAYELGLATPARFRLAERWSPALGRIASATGGTAYLMVRSDFDAVCVDEVQGSTPVRAIPFEIGERLPLGLGSASLAILASLDDEEIETILKSNREVLRLYGKTATEKNIRLGVEQARANGHGYTVGTYGYNVASGVPGIVGLGFLADRGTTLVAVSISLISTGLSDVEQKKLVRIMRREIEAQPVAQPA